MKATETQQTVIFLHIVKTGGTTLHQIIERQYQPEEIYWIGEPKSGHDFDHLHDLDVEEKVKIRMLRGHMTFGLHELLPQPATYFTLLRDPVERVISYYYFITRTPKHPAYEPIVSHNMSLKEAIENQVDPMLINGQTKVLAGGKWSRRDTPESLQVAKGNLQKYFTVVGLVERFDETLFLLKRAFGWRNLFYTPQRVAKHRPRKQDLASDTLEVVLQANQLDAQLYRYVAERFAETVRQQGPLFAGQVRLFQIYRRSGILASRFLSALLPVHGPRCCQLGIGRWFF